MINFKGRPTIIFSIVFKLLKLIENNVLIWLKQFWKYNTVYKMFMRKLCHDFTLNIYRYILYFVLTKYINSKWRCYSLLQRRNSEKFRNKYARLKFSDKTLSQSGILSFNKLPRNIKTIPPLTVYKINLNFIHFTV